MQEMARRHLLLHALLALASAAAGSGGAARYELVRAAPGASAAELVHGDRRRHAAISASIESRCRRAAETAAFAMPLSSGAYTGTGQYFVRFQVGTPAQQFLLVVDTGSDLTWVKCRTSPAPADASSPPLFRADKSKSWAPIPCSSDTCKLSIPFTLANCSTPHSPCAYDYRYHDNSAAIGIAGTDTASIVLSGRGHKKAELQDVVLGCTTSYGGQSFSAADGVLSLGNSNVSFATHAAARFGGRFSYCLVDHLAPRNASSFLTFGPNLAFSPHSDSKSTAPGAQQTPLLLGHRMLPFYDVTVDAIFVAGKDLDIHRDVWDVEKGGGVILDSGTSLTVLAAPAYKAVVSALSKSLARLPTVTMDPFEFCYNWTSHGDDASAVPKLAVRFEGAARLEPPAKSYVIDAAPGVKCIGVQEGPWPGVSVIGNIMQQEHLWEFDLTNRRVRFKPSQCTD